MMNRKKQITPVMGVLVILISCFVLAGWIFDITLFKSVLPTLISMKFNTAICFLLMGVGLLLADSKQGARRALLIGCVMVTLFFSIVTLFEYGFRLNLGIDEWLWKEGAGTAETVFPGRISVPAAISFILIGTVLLLIHQKKAQFFIWLAIVIVFLISSLAFLGYIFAIPYLNSSGTLTKLALLTSIVFIILCAGIYYSSGMVYTLFSFRQKLAIGFLLIGLVLAVVIYIYYENDQNFIRASKWVEHTNDVLNKSEKMLSALTTAESAVRAYVLTSDKQVISDLNDQKNRILAYCENIKEFTQDNPGQQRKINELLKLVHQKVDILDAKVALRKTNNYSSKKFLLLLSQGDFIMNSVRQLVASIQEVERGLLEQRKKDNLVIEDHARRIIYFFGFLILVILLILLIVIVKNMNARIRAEQSIRDLNTHLEKRVEERSQELLKAEYKFHYTLDNMLEGAQIIDFDWRYVYVNDAFLQYARHTREEMIGHTVMEMYPGIESTKVYEVYQRCFNERVAIHLENRFVFPDGSVGWFELSFQPLPDGIFILSFDITSRKQAEEDLQHSERIYRTVASSIPGTIICLFDEELRYVLIEGNMLSQLGYSKEELMGKKVQEAVSVERYNELLPRFRQAFAGESLQIEEERNGIDMMMRYVPLRNADHQVYAVMNVLFDVTELKKAQREISELNHGLEEKIQERTAQLASANKELESFSYSVSHDLRAPLRGIDGWSLALLEDYGSQLDERAHKYLDRVRSETQRMGELIDDLLKLSRVSRAEVKLSTVNLSELAHEIIQRLRAEYQDRQIDFRIEDGLYVLGDMSLLEIMLTNLLSNACKFTGKTAHAMIEFGSAVANEKQVWYIKDNGAGFNMANAKNLFGAFQRMHRQSEFPGTGIGLATVQRIIQLHYGTIWAEAEINKGATFYFMIPNKHL